MVERHLSLPHEFIVFTDDKADYPEPIIKRSLPEPDLTGWWHKISLLKPGVFENGDRIVYLDLDTLITGSLDEIAAYDGEHARLAPFFSGLRPEFAGPQSGVMAWRGGYGAKIWATYDMTGRPQNLKGGDQYFLNKIAPCPDLWQQMFPGKFGSFKGEGGIIQPERSILCFHGLPRMHQVFPDGWDNAHVPIQDGMKKLGGFWWPILDVECWIAMLASVDEHIWDALRYTRQTRTCIQAGGNVGVYPVRLAQRFETVISFEPEPTNYSCMVRNTIGSMVGCIYAALSDVSDQTVSLQVNPENIGQAHIAGDGEIRTMRIDDLKRDDVDLIYLDIEGYEMKALRGAAETIQRCRPTIVIEDNGLSERYGIAKNETPMWVCREFNYNVAACVGRDFILTPKEA
jgi:FkbM family methyltransferase